MPDEVTRLTVFAASPSDVQPERDALGRVVEELNRTIAGQAGFVLHLQRWETDVRPGVGHDAQEVINRQVRAPDAVVGIFWSRMGTPTPRADSGTAEEIQAALERWSQDETSVEVLTYFSQAPQSPDDIDPDQLRRLREFRREMQSRGVLTRSYDSVGEFERLIREHLSNWVLQLTERAVGERTPTEAGRVSTAAGAESDLRQALAVDVDVHHADQVMRLSAEIRSLLTRWSFSAATVDAVHVCVNELLANVAAHTASRTARLELDVVPDFSKGVSIDVYSEGPDFDVDLALQRDLDALTTHHDREHGLLAVAKLTGNLHPATKYAVSGWVGVGCYVHEPEPRYPQYLRHLAGLAVVSIEEDARDRFWVGSHFRYGRESTVILKHAVEHGSSNLLSAFFEGLGRRDRPLAIEYAGATPVTTAFELLIGEPHRRFAHVRSRRPLRAALEAAFPDAFLDRKVLMLSHDTGYGPDLTGWAELWGITPRDDPRDLLRSLQPT